MYATDETRTWAVAETGMCTADAIENRAVAEPQKGEFFVDPCAQRNLSGDLGRRAPSAPRLTEPARFFDYKETQATLHIITFLRAKLVVSGAGHALALDRLSRLTEFGCCRPLLGRCEALKLVAISRATRRAALTSAALP
eukprot:3400256-Pleurochrysis_carterae.AAC.1